MGYWVKLLKGKVKILELGFWDGDLGGGRAGARHAIRLNRALKGRFVRGQWLRHADGVPYMCTRWRPAARRWWIRSVASVNWPRRLPAQYSGLRERVLQAGSGQGKAVRRDEGVSRERSQGGRNGGDPEAERGYFRARCG